MRRPLLLLLDDAPDVGHIAAYLCRRTGQDLVVRKNATSALEYLRAADPLPDLLLLDVNLPGRNGLDFFRELRDTVRLAHMPVALFTQITMPDAVARALDEGIDFVLAKDALAQPGAWKERTEEILYSAAHPPTPVVAAVEASTAAIALRAAVQHPTVLRLGPNVARALWHRAVSRAVGLVSDAQGGPAVSLAHIDVASGGPNAIDRLLAVFDSHPQWTAALVAAVRHQIECLLGRREARAAVASLAPLVECPPDA